VLEPTADGFRNYVSLGHTRSGSAESLLVEQAQLLTLTSSEMTVLVGGLRVLDANAMQSPVGILTKRPGILTNDFFVNILDMSTSWNESPDNEHLYEGRQRTTATGSWPGKLIWTGSRADLVFGSNSELRAIAEYYACDDSKQDFVADFVAAWAKVMNLDRFDLGNHKRPMARL